jgi:hypothetical protein
LLVEVLAFVVSITLLLQFMHVNVLILRKSYRAGFAGRGIQPLFDFILLFAQSIAFYLLSHTFTQVRSDQSPFFGVIAAILVLDICWLLISFLFEPARKVVLWFVLQNAVTLGLGALLLSLRVAGVWVLGMLIARNVLDFALSYNTLFPGAFRRQRAVCQRARVRV